MFLSSKVHSAVINILEYCHVSVQMGISSAVLDQLDLSDESFHENIWIIEAFTGSSLQGPLQIQVPKGGIQDVRATHHR